MSKYKFTREMNTFCWGNDDLKIVFCNPKITTNCKSPIYPEDIEFFDYSIEVYTRTFIDGERVWEKSMHIFGEDLPIAEKLGDLITKTTNIDATQGQSETFGNGNTLYTNQIEITSIDSEFWIIQKSIWNHSDDVKRRVGKDFNNFNQEEYTVIFGEVGHQGFYFPVVVKYLSKEELLELKKTVDEFYKFAILKTEDI